MHSDREVNRISIQPHVDPAIYATVLYLNPEEDEGRNFILSPIMQLDLLTWRTFLNHIKEQRNIGTLKSGHMIFLEKATELIDNDTMLIEDVLGRRTSCSNEIQ